MLLLVAVVFSVVIGYYEFQVTPGHHDLIEDYGDAITIQAIVVLNAVVSYVQEYRPEKAMEAMRKLIDRKPR